MQPWNVGNLEGLIPILGGTYLWLMLSGVVPRAPKHPERMDAWRAKYGTILKVVCPLTIVFGLLQLIGIV